MHDPSYIIKQKQIFIIITCNWYSQAKADIKAVNWFLKYTYKNKYNMASKLKI